MAGWVKKQLSRLINSYLILPLSPAVEAAMEGKGGLAYRYQGFRDVPSGEIILMPRLRMSEALVEGSIIVALVLIPFFDEWRNLAICLTALPLSLLVGVLLLNWLGQGLNTMTLGEQ